MVAVLLVENALDGIVDLVSADLLVQLHVLKRHALALSHLLTDVGRLNDAARHANQSIDEAEITEVVVRGDLKLCDELSAVGHIGQDTFLVWDQFALCLAQLNDESFQAMAWDPAETFGVKLLPALDEVINIVLVDWHTVSLRLTQKRVNDNGHEQVQEHLAHNNVETVEESNRPDRGSAAVRDFTIVLPCVVVKIVLTLEKNRLGAHVIVHNGVPSLACSVTHQQHSASDKVLEVDVVVQLTGQSDERKL